MSDDDDESLREHTIICLRGMLLDPNIVLHMENTELGTFGAFPPSIQHYIARRLLPILEAEEAAKRGRPGEPGAGELVQAFIDGGMDPKEARKLVHLRTGLKYKSVVSAHNRFLKTGRQALFYK